MDSDLKDSKSIQKFIGLSSYSASDCHNPEGIRLLGVLNCHISDRTRLLIRLRLGLSKRRDQ